MTADKELLAAILDFTAAGTGTVFRGTPAQFAHLTRVKPDQIPLLRSTSLQSTLQGYGIAVWFSRFDDLIRLVDQNCRNRLCCSYCTMPESQQELIKVDGHNLHKRCAAAWRRENRK